MGNYEAGVQYNLQAISLCDKINTEIEATNSSIMKEVTVWPNPNKGSFSFYLSTGKDASKITLQLIDISGGIVYQKDVFPLGGVVRQNIIARNLPAGIYFLKYYSPAASGTAKVQIE